MRTLVALCDLSHTAASYDFVTWLVRAMHERDRTGCKALHVVICPKDGGFAGFAREWGKHNEHETRWRFWHICMASIPLAGPHTTVSFAPNRWVAEQIILSNAFEEAWIPKGKAHFMGPLIEAARAGETIPKLRATEQARRYVADWFHADDKVITMTTRKQTTDADRNSSYEGQRDFYQWLYPQEYRLVQIFDSHVELATSGGIQVAGDPDLRLALYERAAMNILPNCGVGELCKFSDAPFMQFGLCLTPAWADHWRKYFSMEPGQQLPWSRPDQRMIYKPDSFENLREEFRAWELGAKS